MSRGTVFGVRLPFFPGYSLAPARNLSDHFDGRRFFNPTLEKRFSPGVSDVFRMMRGGRSKWPAAIGNTATPRLNAQLEPNDVALTFVNHATFLIQMPGLNILTDPVWAKRVSPVAWAGPKRIREPGVALDDLPKIDAIIISHNHYDHLDIETLKTLNDRFSPKHFVPVGDGSLIESIGIKNVQELDWWERADIGASTRITFCPAQHSSARGLFDRDRSLWGSYFIQSERQSVYFGGDSGYSTHYAEIKRRIGRPDIALLGIGSYAPRWFMKAIHMDPAEAVMAHKDLGAKVSIGMHIGTYQLSAEAVDQPQADLTDALHSDGLSLDDFTVLPEGETRLYRAGQQLKRNPESSHTATAY